MADNINANPHAGDQDPIDVKPGVDPSTPADMGEQLPVEKLTILKRALDVIVENVITHCQWGRRGNKIHLFWEDARGVNEEDVLLPDGASNVTVTVTGKVIIIRWTTSNGGGSTTIIGH